MLLIRFTHLPGPPHYINLLQCEMLDLHKLLANADVKKVVLAIKGLT